MSHDKEKIIVVYDGECPFCSRYVRLVNLRKVLHVELVDARMVPDSLIQELTGLDLDLDEGMAVKYDGNWLHGSDALWLMSLLSTPSGFFNRINAWLFRNRYFSRAMYPLLRFFRNATLRLLGRKKINQE